VFHVTEYRERRDHFAWFACSAPVHGFETSREAFLGAYRGWDRPLALERGALAGSIAHGWQPIGALQATLVLQPGETREVAFVLGYTENPADRKFDPPGSGRPDTARARTVIDRYGVAGRADADLAAIRAAWTERLAALQVATGDPHVDRMVNTWNPYQCMVTFNLSRSASMFESGIGRGMGFRDSNQDLLGLVHVIPERARARILDIAATQLPDGGAYHQYQPLTKRGNHDVGSGFNDDPAWLVLAVAAYIKETGDLAILDAPVPWDNAEGSETPLHDHLRRCIDFTLERLGPHGLPLIGRADWNDCLNLNVFSDRPGDSFQTAPNRPGGVAESVFIAGLFVLAAREAAALAALRGDEAEAARCTSAAAAMTTSIEAHGWDGAWYRRAYDHSGEPVGSAANDEGQLFIEPQGMMAMAGVGLDDGRTRTAIASVRERLATPHGIVLLQPAYTRYHARLQGERRGLLPHQPVADDRRGDHRQRRRRARLLPAHQPLRPRGHLGGAPLRAVRLRTDDRGPGRADARRGQELLADGDGRLEHGRDQPVDPGHPSRARWPARGTRPSGRLVRVPGHPALPEHDLRHRGRAPGPG